MTDDTATAPSTRDRILDVALGLFTEKGFDKTSLREIAEPLGISKAALYYHFESKDAILAAFADRLFDGFDELVERLDSETKRGLSAWADFLERAIDGMLEQRPLFAMFERNRVAFDALVHDTDRFARHREQEVRMTEALADPSVPIADRVRIACSLGVLGAVAQSASAFAGIPNAELSGYVRSAVRDLLRQPQTD